jgi:ATPase subunit of ABC transporter with duplicated ATPase domains
MVLLTHVCQVLKLGPVTSDEKRAYNRAWYEAHKEEQQAKARERHQARLAADPEGTRAAAAAKARARRASDPERQRAYERTQYANRDARTREQKQSYSRDWKRANKERVRFYGLKAAYGISEQEWLDLFAAQGSRCAMCGTDKPGCKQGWHTDHCHNSEKVRGILCRACNLTLGYMGDTLEGVAQTAARCADYLRRVS